jgi:hypothetical protein
MHVIEKILFRKTQLYATLSALLPEWELRHDGWHGSGECVTDADFNQFYHAMEAIEALLLVPTRHPTKVTSNHLRRHVQSDDTVSEGVFILAVVASGLSNMGPSSDEKCSPSNIKVHQFELWYP